MRRVLCRIGVHSWYLCPHMESKKLEFWHCSYCEGSKTTNRKPR